MRALSEAELSGAGGSFDSEALTARLESRRKKRRYAWLAWLCLGSHYLYLGRPATQVLFWLTLGGLLLWWLADLFRIPALVARRNRRSANELLRTWQLEFERRLQDRPVPAPWPAYAAPTPAVPEPRPLPPEPRPIADEHRPDTALPSPPRRRTSRIGAAPVLAALLAPVAAVYFYAPPPVYPRGAYEPSHRTLRQVNVRAQPSTSSAIVGKIGNNVLLRGTVEQATGKGPSVWLRLTRGDHAGRYVAMQNLSRR